MADQRGSREITILAIVSCSSAGLDGKSTERTWARTIHGWQRTRLKTTLVAANEQASVICQAKAVASSGIRDSPNYRSHKIDHLIA
jgi:hypothetical protein